MRNKIISRLMALMFILSMIPYVAFAASFVKSTNDFSGLFIQNIGAGQYSPPGGYTTSDSFLLNATSEGVYGVFGKDLSDQSHKIAVTEGAKSVNARFNLLSERQFDGFARVSFKLAANNTLHNLRGVQMAAKDSTGRSQTLYLISLFNDKIYALNNNEITAFRENKWYSFDCIFSNNSDKMDLYIDGRFNRSIKVGNLANVNSIALTYGIFSCSVANELYVDDIILDDATIPDLDRTDKGSSDVVIVDNENSAVLLTDNTQASSLNNSFKGASAQVVEANGEPYDGLLTTSQKVKITSLSGRNSVIYEIKEAENKLPVYENYESDSLNFFDTIDGGTLSISENKFGKTGKAGRIDTSDRVVLAKNISVAGNLSVFANLGVEGNGSASINLYSMGNEKITLINTGLLNPNLWNSITVNLNDGIISANINGKDIENVEIGSGSYNRIEFEFISNNGNCFIDDIIVKKELKPNAQINMSSQKYDISDNLKLFALNTKTLAINELKNNLSISGGSVFGAYNMDMKMLDTININANDLLVLLSDDGISFVHYRTTERNTLNENFSEIKQGFWTETGTGQIGYLQGYADKNLSDASVFTQSDGNYTAETSVGCIISENTIISMKVAADDKAEDKKVKINDTEWISMGKDGLFTVFGEEAINNYDTQRFYNIQIVVHSYNDLYDLYINGVEYKIGARLPASIMSVDKIKLINEGGKLVCDDISILHGVMDDDSVIEFTPVNIGYNSDELAIYNIKAGTVIEDFDEFLSTNGMISIVDSDYKASAGEITSDKLIKIMSPDGKNTLYLNIWDMSMELVLPENGQRITEYSNMRAQAVYSGSIEINKVEFFLNNKLIKTFSSAPFTFEYKMEQVGEYEIYAVAYTNNGYTVKSGTKTVNVVKNELPTVSIEGLSAICEIDYATEKVFTILADDDGEIKKVQLFINGELAGETDKSPYKVKTDKIQPGMNIVYAVAYDSDNEKASSETYNVTAKKLKSSSIINSNDGTSVPATTSWARYNWTGSTVDGDGNTVTINKLVTTSVESGEDRGAVYKISLFGRTGIPGTPAFNSAGSINSNYYNGVTELSVDIKRPNGVSLGELFLLRILAPVNTTVNPASVSADGQLKFRDSAKVVNIEPDKWYNYKIIINNETSTYSFYLNDEFMVGGQYASNKVTQFDGIRIAFSTNEETATAYMDNLIVRKLVYDNSITAVTYVNEDGMEIAQSKAPNNATGVRLYFQAPLKGSTVNVKNIKVYEENIPVKNYNVSYNSSGLYVQVDFPRSLEAQYSYKIVADTNVTDTNGIALPMPLMSLFKVEKDEFDLSSFKVIKNGNEISNLQSLKPGDIINMTLDFKNDLSYDMQRSVVIAVHSGNVLIGSKAFDINVAKGQSKQIESDNFTLGSFNQELRFEVYVVDNLTQANPTKGAAIFK